MKTTTATLKAHARDLELPEDLYLRWFKFNNFIARFIPKKSKYEIKNLPNSLKIGEFLIEIFFINNEYLELRMRKGETQILSLRLPDDPTEEDTVIVCVHILLVLDSY